MPSLLQTCDVMETQYLVSPAQTCDAMETQCLVSPALTCNVMDTQYQSLQHRLVM